MPSAYRQDLREKVMQKILSGEWTQREASRHFSISKRTLRRWISRWKQEENYTRKPNDNRPSHIQDLDHFLTRVLSSPDQTLDELAEIYGVSRSTLHRTFQRAKIRDKKTFLYQERKEEDRQKFLEALEKIPLENRLYMDESGMDDNEVIEDGYAPKGERCYVEKKSRKTYRTTFISAYSPVKRALIAPFTFEGYTHSEIFWRWLENCFKGALKGAPTLILDNASFHQ